VKIKTIGAVLEKIINGLTILTNLETLLGHVGLNIWGKIKKKWANLGG
jgi:hypothetical protein